LLLKNTEMTHLNETLFAAALPAPQKASLSLAGPTVSELFLQKNDLASLRKIVRGGLGILSSGRNLGRLSFKPNRF
jgi:hypothetical protein